MDKATPQQPRTVLAEEQPITANNYQAPIIEVYNPNQLTQSATQIISETNSGYYS